MSVDIQVEIDLNQVATMDLIEELKSRRGPDKDELKVMDVWEVIDYLKDLGCPKNILDLLFEWERLPIANQEKLNSWLVTASVK